MIHAAVAIIGAGAIGLAIARRFAQALGDKQRLVVLEQATAFGTGISSRNSEVMHSGIYYPTHSLKHRLCVAGKKKLLEYLRKKNIPYALCGKLIVATRPEQLDELKNLATQAGRNHIQPIAWLSGDEAKKMQPGLRAESALHLPETGIFNAHALVSALAADFETAQGFLVYGARVTKLYFKNGIFHLTLANREHLSADWVINAAGLGAEAIAKTLGHSPQRVYPCKGSYFFYDGPHPIRKLVYPLPSKNLTGLGIHATINLSGRLRFGPDAEYVPDMDDFGVDPARSNLFTRAAKELFPDLDGSKLAPDLVGIRPKLQSPGDNTVRDFHIAPDKHFPRCIHLLGIESPGLTACLAVADYVWVLMQPALE
jgi:L-2-hydroxyglutarate oxidase LhgO